MPHLSIGALGSLAITLDGQTITEQAYGKVWALLLYLAQTPGQAHRRERLAGLLWPDQTEESARTNLRQALARLRKTLGSVAEDSGDPSASHAQLLANRNEVQFNADSDYTFDVSEFSALLSTCATHVHRDAESCPTCAERRAQALALYRGPFLENFYIGDSDLFEEWAALVREPLHQRAMDALAALVAYHERHGNYAQALAYCERQLALEPWREEAYRQIMRLLARSGQRSVALHWYERCRTTLEVELGAAPAAETVALYEQICAAEFDGPLKTVDLTRPTKRRDSLPLQPTPFLGREEERAALAGLLADPACRLITLLGPGGSGKTRLALQVAREASELFADGTFFVNLAPLSSAEHIVPAVAVALDYTLAHRAAPLTELLHYLHTKELLLILDNYEHLLAPEHAPEHENGSATALLTELLQRAPGVTMLATSRERLNLQGEWVFDVRGLATPPAAWPASEEQSAEAETFSAVALFLQTARRVQQGFHPTAVERSAIVQICRLVQGMPLALELAASWVRTLSCRAIAGEISQGIGFLTTTLRDLPERHRSLQAVFDHSWQLLSPAEQHVFAACSVFRGGCTREAAAAVAGASLADLAALVDKSLLRRDPNDRYEVHELARQYAAARLAAAGEEAQIRNRHLSFFMRFAEEAEPQVRSSKQAAQWHDRVAREHDNLRAALDWSLTGGEFEPGLRMVGALWEFWMNRGYAREGQRQAERFLVHPAAAAPTLLRARALHTAGVCAFYQSRYADALPWLAESAAIGAALGASGRMIRAMALIATNYTVKGQSFDFARIQALCEEILQLGEALEDVWILGHAWGQLCSVAWKRGDYVHALHYGRKSLAYFQAEGGSYVMSGTTLHNLGAIHYEQGDYAASYAYHRQSLAVFENLGDRWRSSGVFEGLGRLALAQGDEQAAEELLEHALLLIRGTGHLGSQLYPLDTLIRLRLRQEDFARALALCQEAFQLSVEMDHQGWQAHILEAFACIAAGQGQMGVAAHLFSAAITHYVLFGGLFEPNWQAENEQWMERVRAQIGEAAFDAAWAKGAAMTLEETKALVEAIPWI